MYFKGGHDYLALAVKQTQHDSFDIACTVITLDHLELEQIGTIRRSALVCGKGNKSSISWRGYNQFAMEINEKYLLRNFRKWRAKSFQKFAKWGHVWHMILWEDDSDLLVLDWILSAT